MLALQGLIFVTTIIHMKIAFDSAKDAANQEKHGISLALAADLDWSTEIAIQDTRYEYSEVRMKGFLVGGVRLYCVIYTDRDGERRIISLRKANRREVVLYEKATED